MDDNLKDYKKELIKVHEKSQESFEKQLSYISAGGLSLSMIFIDKVVKNIDQSNYKWLLALSWILLGITLVVNLISHSISAKNTYKTLEEIENDKFNYEEVIKRHKSGSRINDFCTYSLLIGILLLISFVTINLYMTHSIDHPKPETGQIPPPPPVVRPIPNTSFK